MSSLLRLSEYGQLNKNFSLKSQKLNPKMSTHRSPVSPCKIKRSQSFSPKKILRRENNMVSNMNKINVKKSNSSRNMK